ncbi:hypothetical protein OUZ56_016694 [Daphnia magna]|uniref:THAP-type domain-containing protein n=1 Tax=Daphnia magna TaxID=35525 RepID=A0ABR0ARA3_9CRUS|nr:hypothetical protein OUZ56_016694 [Daphnia magna]
MRCNRLIDEWFKSYPKMVKRCFIEDCCTGKDKENGPAIFFRIPKHRLEEWRGILPKMWLLDSSRSCWRHFDEDVTSKFILGKFYPQQLWRLRDGATPKHLLGTPISSLVQNQLTTLPHTDCTNSSQPITESLCTKALSDSGCSQVTTFDVSLMDSAPVPITTALPDPGSSQVTTFDDSLLDSALVPITTALPGMLILEYVKVRYFLESKRLNNLSLSKEKASVQASFELGTTAHTKDVNTK